MKNFFRRTALVLVLLFSLLNAKVTADQPGGGQDTLSLPDLIIPGLLCCPWCEPCTGTNYICYSEYQWFVMNFMENCGPGSSVTIYWILNC